MIAGCYLSSGISLHSFFTPGAILSNKVKSVIMWISDVTAVDDQSSTKSTLPFSQRGADCTSLSRGVLWGGEWEVTASWSVELYFTEQSVVYIMSFTVLTVCAFCGSTDQTEKQPIFFNLTIMQTFPRFYTYKIFGPCLLRYDVFFLSMQMHASECWHMLFLLAEIWISPSCPLTRWLLSSYLCFETLISCYLLSKAFLDPEGQI